MKFRFWFYIYIPLMLLASLALSSCVDDDIYTPQEIGEGECHVKATVNFKAFTPSLDSRAAGDIIKNISNLTVLIYDSNEDSTKCELIEQFYFDDTNKGTAWNVDQNGNSDKPDDQQISDNPKDNPHWAETQKTPRATCDFNVPYGRYHIYVVANTGKLSDEEVETVAKLKNIELHWDNEHIGENAQMFGYFTLPNAQTSTAFRAPLVTLGTNNTSTTEIALHAWIRRAASKVTVAFDPSGLKDNVYIYIKNVTIRDVPSTCLLGAVNKATASTLYKNGTGPDANVSQTISYVKPGATDPDDYKNWPRIAKGTSPEDILEFGSSDHSETGNALFFYENMQGDFEGKGDFYNKVMQDEVKFGDKPIRNPGEPDFKDAVDDGTYIEVVGYYESRNPDRITSGPIKYRFMLGKNITYNYDAERNHHYKLTLKFKNFANEADWHIDYVENPPFIATPTKFYVPYLYGKKAGEGLPVRLSSNVKSLKAEIIENNWAPYDESTDTVPVEHPGGDFYWNSDAFNFLNDTYNNKTAYYGHANFVGFLSLREIKVAVLYESGSPDDGKYGYGPNTMTLLQQYYTNNQLWHVDNYNLTPGTHNVNGVDQHRGTYEVKKDEDKSITVMVPMWTRPKSMGRMTGFTGNNPFASYQRKAVVRFTATFDTDEGEKTLTKDVPVFQVRRIENPKAIWRSRGNTDPFDVVLTHWASPTATEYTPFNSEGKWRVSVSNTIGDNSWVQISLPDGTGPDQDGYIHGSTDTPIKFRYKPSGAATSDRSAIIKVEYHDYTCEHSIFVRQGYDDDVELTSHKNNPSDPVTLWSSHNVYGFVTPGGNPGGDDANPVEANRPSNQPRVETSVSCRATVSPLSIGSLFKRGQYNYAILERNNDTYGFTVNPGDSGLTVGWYADNSATTLSTRSRAWTWFYGFAEKNSGGDSRLDWKWAGSITALNVGNRNYRVPTYEDFDNLTSDSLHVDYGYGIVYGDGAPTVNYSVDDASAYTDYNNTGAGSDKGVKACVIYNNETANQILLPMGGLGYGCRRLSPYLGSLNYGPVREVLSNTINGGLNRYRPLIYNIWHSDGAIYWTNQIKINGHLGTDNAHAWDINYFSFDFGPFDNGGLNAGGSGLTAGNSSAAFPIKLVRSKP